MDNLLQKLMLGGSTAALVAAMSIGASAQDNSDIEQVVVSASRVTIAGYSQPTPVTVVGAAQLEQDAFAAIQDSVRQLPQVTSPPSSFNNESSLSGGSNGTNFVNLRNLGLTRTLILFDGQRVVASNITGGVDITTLPSAMISRVDVVTGGASAAWGSDAVAGVVNFVLNKNFTGFKATVQGGDTYNGLRRDFSLESAWGDDIFGGRGHIEVAANADIKPDNVLLIQENWFKAAYFVSNPAYVAGNGQPQLIVATNVGPANATMGGIINSSPAVTAANSPTGVAIAANALRGIEFVGAGIPQLVNYGNVTNGSISNGGSLTPGDGSAPWAIVANHGNTYTFFTYGRYKLTDTIQASVQLNYGYFTGFGGSGNGGQTGLVIKSDNAFIPASVRATMQATGITSFTMGTPDGNNYDSNNNVTGATFSSQAQSSLAPSFGMVRRNLIRGVFTLEGTIGDDWGWNAYIQHSAVRLNIHVLGNPIVANLQNAEDAVTVTTANRGTSGLPLGSIACRSTLTGAAFVVGNVTAQPGCIPLDVLGNGNASPAAIGYILGATNNSVDFTHEETQQDVAEGSMQGTLPWELPAGKIAVAFGAGYRKEAGWQNTTTIGTQAGYVSGNYPTYSPVSYNVLEGFAEVDAPILKNNIVNSLDFSMAGRMTSYSTSGLVETWKLGATSQINDDIKLRTTWSVDIRAPQLSDLYSPGVVGSNSQKDPRTQATVFDLNITTGNPNLVPEVARTISGGVVLTPTFIEGLSLSADWYSINLTGAIASIAASTILNQCNATLPSAIYPGQNGNPNDPLCTHLVFNGSGGALSQINLSELNFASQTVSGLDLQANYTMDFWDGSLAWASTANYNDENTLTQPGTGRNDFAGSNDVSGAGLTSPGPKWKGVLAATYTTGPYSFTAQARWFGTSVSYRNGNTGNQASAATANLYDPARYELPFTAYLDLRGNYKWNDNIQVYGAIDNTLNTPPPLLPALSGATSITATGFYNTNTNVYDMLGRTFRIGVRFNY